MSSNNVAKQFQSQLNDTTLFLDLGELRQIDVGEKFRPGKFLTSILKSPIIVNSFPLSAKFSKNSPRWLVNARISIFGCLYKAPNIGFGFGVSLSTSTKHASQSG